MAAAAATAPRHLSDNPDLRRLDADGIAAIIRRGMPGGMPAFASLPQAQVTRDFHLAQIHE